MLEQALRFAFVAVSAFMAARLFWLTDTYAVDILFLDHWYYFEGLFRDHSLFDLFRWQHGPHRQGAGFLLTKVIAGATGWNLRAESFALCGLVCTAAAMAWWLKHRVAGPFNWGDIAVPLIFLSPLQFATFVNTPNPAHSALPLLLIVCVALTWEIERPWLRYMVLMILNVIVVHTGFGIFAGIVLAFLFACEILRIRNANESESIALPALALVVSLCAMAWFFVGYDTRITLPDSGAAEANWWSYPRFMAISVSRLLWMRGDRAEPVGFLVLAFSAWALVYHVRILILDRRESARSRAVVLFVGFGLLFAAGIAAGRLPIGLRAGTASRYMTLLSLLYFGLYLGAFSIRGRIQQGMLAAAIALLIYGAIPLRNSTMERMAYFRDNKVQWRDTYLMTESIEAASRAVSLPVHPDPNSSRLAEQLAYLKDRKLSFFRQVDRHEPMPPDHPNERARPPLQ